MGLFSRKKQTEKKGIVKISADTIRIQIVLLSTECNNSDVTQCTAIINAKKQWSFTEFIKELIQNYCPKVSKKSGTWILEYKKRPLAVFNNGSGHINIINENFVNMSIKDLIGENTSPQIFLHYIGEETIGDIAKTMIDR